MAARKELVHWPDLFHDSEARTFPRMTRGPEVASFAYHDVGDDPSATGFQRPGALPFKLTPRAFEQHLEQIATSPLTPALVDEIDLTRPGRHLLLTFDDGGKSALHVSEELCRRGWRGHFFIVTSLIGRRTFLDAAEVRQLRSCGHLIGSHSHTHPDIFRDQPARRMVEEWRVSCDTLSDLLGEPVVTASVPGGDISSAVLRSAGAAGLRYLFTSEPWLSPRAVGSCWILGRLCPKARTSPCSIHELVHFRGWARALMLRRVKGLMRRSLPPLYRLYVRQMTHEW